MQKAQFTIGVDVSRNTLDIYCIEAGQHITIDNNSIALNLFNLSVTAMVSISHRP